MAIGKLKNIFKEKEDNFSIGSEDEYYTISENEAAENVDNSKNSLIVIEPRAYSETQQVADYLKNRNSVIVNLKRVTKPQAQRIMDFVYGCVYAIGGHMQAVGDSIYLCTPKNVTIQGKIEEENAKSSKNLDDEIDW